jgi:periplasmic protein CpxP/Spy
MVRFRSLTIGLVVAALLATGVAFAQGPRGGPGGRGRGGVGGPGIGLPLAALNLTEAQRTQIQEIRDRHRDELSAAMTTLEKARRAQQAAIEKVPADEAQITSLTQDMTQAQVDVAIQSARMHTEVWSVLTPEQRAEVTKRRAERQARLEERRQQDRQRRN